MECNKVIFLCGCNIFAESKFETCLVAVEKELIRTPHLQRSFLYQLRDGLHPYSPSKQTPALAAFSCFSIWLYLHKNHCPLEIYTITSS